jgi:Fe-S-cluster-containing hydrogenase component 2
MCVAVCPTAALREYAGDGHAGLEFDAAACIACGVCAMVCPDNALAIRALAGSEGASGTATRISRHEQRSCARCDDEFAAREEDEFCPACRKDVGLFTHGFSARSDET